MLPKQAEQIFNVEFQRKLKEAPFPDEFLPFPMRLFQIKHLALQTESPDTVAMPFPEYKVFLMKGDGDYTMFEAAQLFNIIARKTPRDMDMLEDYYDVQEQVYKAAQKWKELKNPIEQETAKKVEIMANNVGGLRDKPLKRIITGN